MVSLFKVRPLALAAALSSIFAADARPPEDPFFQESFLIQGSELIPECYRPTLLCLPDGVMACAWAAGRASPPAIDRTFPRKSF